MNETIKSIFMELYEKKWNNEQQQQPYTHKEIKLWENNNNDDRKEREKKRVKKKRKMEREKKQKRINEVLDKPKWWIFLKIFDIVVEISNKYMMEYQQMSSQTNDGCCWIIKIFSFIFFWPALLKFWTPQKQQITNTLLAINECWSKTIFLIKRMLKFEIFKKCDCYHLTLKNLIHEWKRKYIQIGFDFYFNSRECAPRYKWNKWFACMFFFRFRSACFHSDTHRHRNGSSVSCYFSFSLFSISFISFHMSPFCGSIEIHYMAIPSKLYAWRMQRNTFARMLLLFILKHYSLSKYNHKVETPVFFIIVICIAFHLVSHTFNSTMIMMIQIFWPSSSYR